MNRLATSGARRIAVLATALGGLLLASSCSLNGPVTDASAAGPRAAGSAAPAAVPFQRGPLKVGIAAREIVNDYNRDIIAGADTSFRAAGATVTTTNAGGDATKQINNIQTLVNSGVNVLLIELGDPAQLSPVVTQARAKGVVVVTAGVGSTVPGAVTDVGGDEDLMAEMMSRSLLDAMGYRGDLYAFWVPGAPLLETRLRILKAMVADYPQVRLHLQPSDFSPARVQSQMQAVLTANPDKGSIAGVWGAYDQMTSGAVQAIQQADRSEIAVASIDGDRATFPMLYAPNSPFVATVVQNAQLIGTLAAQAALDARDGKPVAPNIFTTA
ncbi:substrate-binding domain-containing protein [Kineococcus rubinsiae]|uniref:substrate-binding domain-containing protein n=1 Tax=Kineococcus rubinsiae TaxID=2609562 RepID=UPI00143219F6|nr:substrate-binding domain-containing protein [Kineococcus rubinsiae]NIZ90234.1 substrate-binding domain-containing protein [Kineococcus rubinsiae]